MKKIFRIFCVAALAFAAASCAKEIQNPDQPNKPGNFVDVEFGASVNVLTKATLTPNEGETVFTPGWENGDAIKVYYSENSTSGTVDATWNGSSFTATLPEYKGAWDYKACYPAFNENRKIDFGTARTQDGNKFNSLYDIMTGSASATNADAGKDNDGSPIVFNFERQTAILYFHLKSSLNEPIVKAILSVEGGEIANSNVTVNENNEIVFGTGEGDGKKTIELSFPNEAPSATDFTLWFNVKPTAYTSLSLTVATATKRYTIKNTTAGTLAAGKLYEICKNGIEWSGLTFDFFTHPANWETSKEASASGNHTYRLNGIDYTFNFTKNGDGIYCGGKSESSGYLMVANGNKLGIPAIQGFKLVSVKATNSSGCSTSVKVSIMDGDGDVVEGGDVQIWSTKSSTYTYNLTDTDENTVYYLTVSNANCQVITLVLAYEPATARTAQTLSFPEAQYEVADNEMFTAPVLSGAHTTVKYTSSNTKVATVDPSTGEVSIVAAGTTVITAKAEADATYKKGTASYTLTVTPTEVLTTMDAIFEKATAVKSTATPVQVTLNNWVVSGVKNSNAYVTDGTKGFIIYASGHGFAVGDKLSGTVECKIQLFYGSSELTELKSTTEGLTVTKGGTITPATIAIADLSGVNTGAVIKFESLTYNGSAFSDGTNTIKPYNSLIELPTLISGKDYKVTGVYVQFVDKNDVTTKEIAPRTDEDFVLLSPYIAATASKTNIAAAGETITVTVDAKNVESWNATSSDNTNFKITNKGADSFKVEVTANTNTESGRSATITVSANGADDVEIELTQGKAGEAATPTWTRVTTIKELTDGGTFIMGYEATAKSGVIVPLRSADCNATTTALGYFNTGTTAGSSTNGTINMSELTESSDYEVKISSPESGKINIQMKDGNGGYYGASKGGSSKNTGRLYTSGNSDETNLTPEFTSEENNQFKLTSAVTGEYKYLKYNTGSPRFAFYTSAGSNIVFYKKSE